MQGKVFRPIEREYKYWVTFGGMVVKSCRDRHALVCDERGDEESEFMFWLGK